MSLYFPGLTEAIESVRKMTDEQLLQHIDGLLGRENLPENYTHDDLLHEAIMQTKRDFTDTSSSEYETVEFWTGYIKLAKKGN